MEAIKKGNVAEFEIAAELTRVDAVKRVATIANQYDPNHYDLLVTFVEGLGDFRVQAKWFNEARHRLQMNHVKDWLGQPSVTIPMWWRDESRQTFWADPLRRLIRRGGLAGNSVDFSREDLRILDSQDRPLTDEFVQAIRALFTLWPVRV